MDCQLLQKDLANMNMWTVIWLLTFHPDKCHYMRIGHTTVWDLGYSLNGRELAHSETEKDLGIIIDSKLDFSKHIAEKVNKANSVLGTIRRTFKTLEKDNFKILFSSLVRPIIEYGSPVWSPRKNCDNISIENVQRRATKLIPGMKDLSYDQRLKSIGLTTLAYRRLRSDMIETYKITHGIYDEELTQGIFVRREASVTRGHNYKLFQQQSRREVRSCSFAYRVIPIWNSLPADVVNATSVASFKRKLDRAWENLDLKYDITARI